jgi:hypothetical protein
MYYYWDEEKEMMLIKNFKPWLSGNGEGDALWRTSIAYITYPKEKKFKKGILRAFRKKENSKYQACRCNPNFGEDDVSRDQVILAWSSLYLNNDIDELKELVLNTSFKLSKRYNQTITMWFWTKGLIGNKFAAFLGQFFLSIELTLEVLWNLIIKKLIKYKDYSSDELEQMMSEPDPKEPWHEKSESIRYEFLNKKWKEKLWKWNFPGYGLHLAAWCNYTGPKNIFNKYNNWLINIDMSQYNLLLKLLTGYDVTENEINRFKPREEWIWSSRFDKSGRGRILPVDDEYNLDVEILKTIKKRNFKNR